MYQATYYVDKATGAFGDTLLAYGAAALLERLLLDNCGEASVRLRDDGGVFAIALGQPILKGYEKIDWFCDLPFIETRSKQAPPGWRGPRVNYDEQRDRNAAFFAARKSLPKEAKRRGATVEEFPQLAAVEALQPRDDWQVIAQINQMSSISAYTQVLESWQECQACFPELIAILLALFGTQPSNLATAAASWGVLAKRCGLRAAQTVTPVQVLNPSMGKGINRTKADGANRLGNPDSFWPLEFLKFWGMRLAGLPRVVKTAQPAGGRGPRDRKTYVLHPYNITLRTHRQVYRAFNQRLIADTAVKMDVIAALRYTDTYLEQWLAGQVPDMALGEEPGDHVRGLTTAFYKDMGNAVAVLNLSEVALPHWMRVESPQDGRAYRELLEEHQRVVSSLAERNADEYRLLQSYRDFLSGRDLTAFFAFTGAYSALLLGRMERGQWAPRFLTTNLEVLIMGHDRKLKPILDTPGFQNVATAIRRSTVTPQYFKARSKRSLYDIRYGLGTDLLRYAAYPDRFVQALGKFMHEYNQENGQINERYKGAPPVRRSNITTEDIAQVVALIDEYDSPTVANLLVAYGYAREPREPEAPADGQAGATEELEEPEE